MTQTLLFDTRQSQSLLLRHIERATEGSTREAPAWALDLGVFPGALAQEQGERWRTVTIGRKPRALRDYLRASGSSLPFRDRAMDVAAVGDVLEHVSPDGRAEMIDEVCRVSNGWILINGPFRFPETEQAESSLNDLARLVTGGPDPRLEEHWQNGLPDLADTRRALEDRGFTTTVTPNGSLFPWFLLKSLDLLFRVAPDAAAQFEQINDLYVRLWSDSDFRRPTYRHLILAHRDPERVLALLQNPPAKGGLEFFGPQTDVPGAGAEEAQRLRSTGVLLERMAAYMREKPPGAAAASLDAAYVARLERIVEEQEQRQAKLKMEAAELRARVAVYETSRFVRLWRRLRWRRG